MLNDNLSGCSFDVKEDGAYITYTLPGGADPVRKKLDSGKSVVIEFARAVANNSTNIEESYTYTAPESCTLHVRGCAGYYTSENRAKATAKINNDDYAINKVYGNCATVYLDDIALNKGDIFNLKCTVGQSTTGGGLYIIAYID